MTPIGRRPGNRDTRQEILDTARELFREQGFDKTSVRGIARGAGVDPAMINHYFGSKEGLFQATLDVPVDPVHVLSGLREATPDELPEALLDRFLSVWEDPAVSDGLVIVMRRALADPEQAGLLRESVVKDLLAAPLVSVVAQRHPQDAELRVGLLITQMLGVVVSRKLLAVGPVAGLTTDELRTALLPLIRHILLGDPR